MRNCLATSALGISGRPGTVVGEGAHVGNFVETKKTKLGKGSKANHLSYLGDAEVGDGTTSVVVLAGEILKESKGFVEEGVSSQVIIKAYRKAAMLAVNKIKEIAVKIDQGKCDLPMHNRRAPEALKVGEAFAQLFIC